MRPIVVPAGLAVSEVVPAWQIHRHIGMGGDQIVTAIAGEEVERRCGDAVRATEGERYKELIGEVKLLPGARAPLVALRARGITTVLASSAKADEVDVYLDMLDGLRDGAALDTPPLEAQAGGRCA